MKTVTALLTALTVALATGGTADASLRDRIRDRVVPAKPVVVVKTAVTTVAVAPATGGCVNGKCSLPPRGGYTGGWFNAIRR